MTCRAQVHWLRDGSKAGAIQNIVRVAPAAGALTVADGPFPIGDSIAAVLVTGAAVVGAGAVIIEAIREAGKGERGREKGRGDDPLWKKSIDELKDIERDMNRSWQERANARRIRTQKQKPKSGC